MAIDHIDHRQHALAAVKCFNFGRDSVNRLGGFRMTPGPLRSVAVFCVGFPTAKAVVEADYWYDSPGPLFDAQMLAFTHFTLFLVKLQPMTMVIYIYNSICI